MAEESEQGGEQGHAGGRMDSSRFTEFGWYTSLSLIYLVKQHLVLHNQIYILYIYIYMLYIHNIPFDSLSPMKEKTP